MTPVMDWMPNLGMGNSGECGRSGGHGLLLLFRGFGGIDQVAGGIVVRPSIDGIAFQLRDHRLANILPEAAARMERAARRRIDRAWYVALEHHAMAALVEVRHRNGRQPRQR